jgi:dTDP-4-dehydrorhamnose 3,5-epimerase
VSRSAKGVLRGLHSQNPHAQGKLVTALASSAFDVVVDIRRGSPTFGAWRGFTLSAYKCTEVYQPAGERRLPWDDPDASIRCRWISW